MKNHKHWNFRDWILGIEGGLAFQNGPLYGETLESVITKWDPMFLSRPLNLPPLRDGFLSPAHWAACLLPYIVEEQRAYLASKMENTCLDWLQLLHPVADYTSSDGGINLSAGWDGPCRSWTVNLKFDLEPRAPFKLKDVVLLTSRPEDRHDELAVWALGVVRSMPHAGETYSDWRLPRQRAPYDIAVYAPSGSALSEALCRSLAPGGDPWYIANIGSSAPYSRMYDRLQALILDPATAEATPLMRLLLGLPPPEYDDGGARTDGADVEEKEGLKTGSGSSGDDGTCPVSPGSPACVSEDASANGSAATASDLSSVSDGDSPRWTANGSATAPCQLLPRLPSDLGLYDVIYYRKSGIGGGPIIAAPADGGGGGEGLNGAAPADGAEIILIRGPPLQTAYSNNPFYHSHTHHPYLNPGGDNRQRTAEVAHLISELAGNLRPGRALAVWAHSNKRVAELAIGIRPHLRRRELQLPARGHEALPGAGLRPLWTGDCVALLACDADAQYIIQDLNLPARSRRLFKTLSGAEGWYGTLLHLRRLLAASEAQLREWSSGGVGSGGDCATAASPYGAAAATGDRGGGGGTVGGFLRAQLLRLIPRLRQQADVLLADLPSAAWAMPLPKKAAAAAATAAAGGAAAFPGFDSTGAAADPAWAAAAQGGGIGGGWAEPRGLELVKGFFRWCADVEGYLGLMSGEEVHAALFPVRPPQPSPRTTTTAAATPPLPSLTPQRQELSLDGFGGGGGAAQHALVVAMQGLRAAAARCDGLPGCRLRVSYQDQHMGNLVTAVATVWGPEGWLDVVSELRRLVGQMPYDRRYYDTEPIAVGTYGVEGVRQLLMRLQELAGKLATTVPQYAWVGPMAAAVTGDSLATARRGKALMAKLAAACGAAVNALMCFDERDESDNEAVRHVLLLLRQRREAQRRRSQPPLLDVVSAGAADPPPAEGAGVLYYHLQKVMKQLGQLEQELDVRGVVSEDTLKMFCLDHARLLFSTVIGFARDDVRRTRGLAVETILLDGANQVLDVELAAAIMSAPTGAASFAAGGGAAGLRPGGRGSGDASGGAAPQRLVMIADPPVEWPDAWAGMSRRRSAPWPRVLSDAAWAGGYGWSAFEQLMWRGWQVRDLKPAGDVPGAGQKNPRVPLPPWWRHHIPDYGASLRCTTTSGTGAFYAGCNGARPLAGSSSPMVSLWPSAAAASGAKPQLTAVVAAAGPAAAREEDVEEWPTLAAAAAAARRQNWSGGGAGFSGTLLPSWRLTESWPGPAAAVAFTCSEKLPGMALQSGGKPTGSQCPQNASSVIIASDVRHAFTFAWHWVPPNALAPCVHLPSVCPYYVMPAPMFCMNRTSGMWC